MTFDDLDFQPHPNRMSGFGVQAKVFFPNGFGASVVRGLHSYGGPDGLFELAVLVGDENSWGLTYDTPITSDVEGHLTPADVTRLLGDIAELPPRKQDNSND